jgi:hypothetical protein
MRHFRIESLANFQQQKQLQIGAKRVCAASRPLHGYQTLRPGLCCQGQLRGCSHWLANTNRLPGAIIPVHQILNFDEIRASPENIAAVLS